MNDVDGGRREGRFDLVRGAQNDVVTMSPPPRCVSCGRIEYVLLSWRKDTTLNTTLSLLPLERDNFSLVHQEKV